MSKELDTGVLNDYNQFFDKENEKQEEQKPIEEKTMQQNTGSMLFSEEQRAKISDMFFEKLRALGVNTIELEPLIRDSGRVLALSVAGSGKSTSLVLKIIHDMVTGVAYNMKDFETPQGVVQSPVPSKMLVTTFLKTGAEDIKRTMDLWVKRLKISNFDYSHIKFSTIHAEVYRILKMLGINPVIETNTRKLVRMVSEDLNIRSNISRSPRVTVDELADIESIFSFARNSLDDKRYTHKLMQEYNIDDFKLDLALKRYKEIKDGLGVLDYEDLQEMLYEGIKYRPDIKEFIRNQYDYVFIDEFQDTSQLQYAILKEYMQGSKVTFIYGDDDQGIYSFRGSDNNIILKNIHEDFKIKIHRLSYNYRCGSNIVDFVKKSIENNKHRYEKEIKAFRQGGEVKVVENSDVTELIDIVKKSIKENKTVGVLARKNAELLIPAIILELEENIDFNLSKSVNMSNQLIRQIVEPMDLVTKRLSDKFVSILSTFLPYGKPYEANKLVDILRSNPSLSIYNLDEEDLKNSVPTLFPILNGLRKAYSMSDIAAYIFLLGYMRENVYIKESVYNQNARIMIGFIEDLILTHPKLKDKGMSHIEHVFNVFLPESMRRRRELSGVENIKLTTVHEAKGKEWDVVCIWNDCEGSFPNQVGMRDLTEDEYEEERRIHYIALTRAKNELLVFTKKAKMGDYLKECDFSKVGKITEGIEKEETTDIIGVKKVDKKEIKEINDEYNSMYDTQESIYIENYLHYLVTSALDDDSPHPNEVYAQINSREQEIIPLLKESAKNHDLNNELEAINQTSVDTEMKQMYYKQLTDMLLEYLINNP